MAGVAGPPRAVRPRFYRALSATVATCRRRLSCELLPSSTGQVGFLAPRGWREYLTLTENSLPKPRRNQHIQSCVSWETAHRLGHLQSEVHYCYHCFDWVIGDQWNSHCQSHLNRLRPGYCPFCMSDPDLPASKQVESWTRDHKLWSHIIEHVTECRWPCACPHPLCDIGLKDAAPMLCHLVDEHGLSCTRPGDAAALAALNSPDDAVSSYGNATRPNRKRKGTSSASPLEWMPPQAYPDATVSPTEPSAWRPSKRSRRGTPTICPAVLSFGAGMSSNQTTPQRIDSVVLQPAPSFRDTDSESTVDVVMPDPDLSPTIDGVVNTVETQSFEDETAFDTV